MHLEIDKAKAAVIVSMIALVVDNTFPVLLNNYGYGGVPVIFIRAISVIFLIGSALVLLNEALTASPDQ